MKADLARGWGRRQKTFGLFEQTRVPYRSDMNVRAQLTLIAQPGSFAEWTHEFPDFTIHRQHRGVHYEVTHRQLVMTVPFTLDQPWRLTEQGRLEIYIEELPFCKIDETRWYDLRAWIVFHEAPKRPVLDVRVWAENRLILPGHFESNHRRH